MSLSGFGKTISQTFVAFFFFQGQVEADIEALGFDRLAIYRPG